MKKRAAIILGIIALAVVIGMYASRSSEPRYQGRLLSQWMTNFSRQAIRFDSLTDQFGAGFWNKELGALSPEASPPFLSKDPALIALQAIGTNAVPWLLAQWHTRPPLKYRFFAFASKYRAPGFLINFLRQAKWSDERPDPIPALRLLGPKAHAAVPLMLRKLAAPNEYVRREARQVIEAAFNPSEDAPPLVAMLTNPIIRVYAFPILAAKAPQYIPKSALLAGFNDPNRALRQAALNAAAHLGTNAIEYLPQIIALTRDKNDTCRYQAIRALGAVGAPAADVLCGLYSQPGENEEWKTTILREVMKPQGDAPKARALLAQYCQENPGNAVALFQNIARLPAQDILENATLLREISALSPQTVTAFLPALDSPELFDRAKACIVLGCLQGDPRQLVPLLTQRLNDPECAVRCNAALALGKYGTNAIGAAITLTAMQHAEGLVERACVRRALQDITPKSASPAR